jgi:hypothetical protein
VPQPLEKENGIGWHHGVPEKLPASPPAAAQGEYLHYGWVPGDEVQQQPVTDSYYDWGLHHDEEKATFPCDYQQGCDCGSYVYHHHRCGALHLP